MVDPLPYATFAFVMSITPGPNNLMLTVSGASFGFRRTLPHMVGISLGVGLQLLAVCAGLGAVFAAWPQTQTVLRWVGAVYLVYLGWKLLGSRIAQGRESTAPITLPQAVIFQFLNPKAWVMSLSAATVFMPRELGPFLADAYVVSMMMLIGFPCIAVWALFGTSLRGWLTRPAGQLVFNGAMALALVVTAILMVR